MRLFWYHLVYRHLTYQHFRYYTYLAIHNSIKPLQLINDEVWNIQTTLSNTENHKLQLGTGYSLTTQSTSISANRPLLDHLDNTCMNKWESILARYYTGVLINNMWRYNKCLPLKHELWKLLNQSVHDQGLQNKTVITISSLVIVKVKIVKLTMNRWTVFLTQCRSYIWSQLVMSLLAVDQSHLICKLEHNSNELSEMAGEHRGFIK